MITPNTITLGTITVGMITANIRGTSTTRTMVTVGMAGMDTTSRLAPQPPPTRSAA